jgi:uncharacterized FlgJ-related protein
MEELIVEGLTTENFLVLEKLIKTYKVSLNDDISFEDIQDLYNKVKQIVDCIAE